MSIPLDKLYHYIKDVVERIHGDHVIIYRFYPHGSKKIEDLTLLTSVESWRDRKLAPEIYCNDQEPLNFDLYQNCNVNQEPTPIAKEIFEKYSIEFPKFNFRGEIMNIWDYALLLHSEKRSDQVDLYQNTQFIPVYYWSHAIIAQDWFRFAQHVTQKKQTTKTFLIYNRAWAGTREYRLRFAELLIHLNLQDECQTSVNPVEPELGIHYETHKFKNPIWRPSTVLENFFPLNLAQSHYSADFDLTDYESTNIEVVLETLFDDSRLHLTEKALRPIACAQPFILAGTHGSLKYLRSYGFKTFGDVWDESYDLVEDPAERLIQIAELMKYISNWTPQMHEKNMAEAQTIADYNKKLFFSKEFSDTILSELTTNLTNAFNELENNNTSQFWSHRKQVFEKYPEWNDYVNRQRTKEDQNVVIKKAQKYCIRNLNQSGQ
jgi:hypothetical protein